MIRGDCDMIRAMSESASIPRVQLGCCVEIKLLSRSGKGEHLEFDLVPDEQADYQVGFLGISTPIAKAILGERAGTTVPYFTDELMAIEVISIRKSTRSPSTGAADRRGAALQEAKDQIEFTNAVLFAASVDTKWGAYDADGLDFDGWKARKSEDIAKDEDG